MNFKKPLSLLLIAGIAVGINASDNDAQKNELEQQSTSTAQEKINDKYHRRIQDDISTSPADDFHMFAFMICFFNTAFKYADFSYCTEKLANLSSAIEISPRDICPMVIAATEEKDIAKISLLMASIPAIYFGVHTITGMIRKQSAWNELSEFKRLKAEIESNQT